MQFQLCENTGFYLRLGLLGPAGSGKTYTALALALELADKVGVIDTENRSARRYAKSFGKRFHSLELDRFSPKDYIEAIYAAEAAGLEALVIDSLSHAWIGKGGVLEMVDHSARRQARGGTPNSFSGWREVTPEHNRLVETMLQARLHLFVTMRTKTEYIVEEDSRGKKVPRKVGLAPVQRDGLEYEFDIIGEMSAEHTLCISKSRCPALSDAVVDRPGKEVAAILRTWLDGAAPAKEEEPQVEDSGETSERAIPRTIQEELAAISPWLRKIQEAEEGGSEEQLDAVRTEMNAALKRRTKAQGEALRRAIETARAAIRSGGGAQGPTQEELEAAAEMGGAS